MGMPGKKQERQKFECRMCLNLRSLVSALSSADHRAPARFVWSSSVRSVLAVCRFAARAAIGLAMRQLPLEGFEDFFEVGAVLVQDRRRLQPRGLLDLLCVV